MPTTAPPGRVLSACFSRPGENLYYSGRRDLDVGNTERLASLICNVRPPMIMSTSTDAHDFTNKTLLPVVTYAVSGLGSTPADYAAACPGARIGDGLAMRGEEVAQQRSPVGSWLCNAGLTIP